MNTALKIVKSNDLQLLTNEEVQAKLKSKQINLPGVLENAIARDYFTVTENGKPAYTIAEICRRNHTYPRKVCKVAWLAKAQNPYLEMRRESIDMVRINKINTLNQALYMPINQVMSMNVKATKQIADMIKYNKTAPKIEG